LGEGREEKRRGEKVHIYELEVEGRGEGRRGIMM